MDLAAPAPSANVALEMAWWLAALWGLFGGLGIEASELYVAIRRASRVPWKVEGEPGLLPYSFSVLIRGGLGSGLALAASETHQVSGPVGAIAIGVAAPFIFEQFKNVRVPRADGIYMPVPEVLLTKTPRPRKTAPANKAQTGSRDGA